MKKTSWKWFIFSIVAALVCSLLVGLGYLFTKPSLSDASDNPEIVANFSNLDVEVFVDKNGKYHVSETFDVTLLRGNLTEVVRFIPYMTSTKYKNNDGSVVTNKKLARVTDATLTTSGNEILNIYHDEITGYITFGIKKQIGRYELNSTHNYTIEYVYDTGNDGFGEFDEFYYNVVGHLTPSAIDNVDISITFENAGVDATCVKCYVGEYGSTNEVVPTVTSDTISAHFASLGANEGVTVRAVFDEGYFDYSLASSKHVSVGAIVALLAVVVFGAIALLICFTKREKNSIMEVVEVTAPEFADTFIAEFYGDGESSVRAATANIVYLANKGYVQIEPSATKGEYKIIKAKDMTVGEEPEYIKATFDALFAKRDAVKTNEENYAYAEKALAAETLVNKEERQRLYDENAARVVKKYVPLLVVLSIVVSQICFVIAMKNHLGFFSMPFNAMFVIFAIILGTMAVMGLSERSSWWMNLLFMLPIGLMLVLMYKNAVSVIDSGYFLVILSVVIVFTVSMTKHFAIKMNSEGKNRLERMLGFKNYIKLVEVDRIKVLAEENPNYFYDVLPYAYAFGLSNVWVEKFKNLTILPPSWYVSGGGEFSVFDYLVIHSMFRSFDMSMSASIQKHRVQIARSALDKFSSSSGGGHFGGFSGGGFSGGGSGGGGFGAR